MHQCYAQIPTKQPMYVIATAGSGTDAPVTERRRTFMDEGGNGTVWYGRLEQPMVHSIYRKYFNSVDVQNKLTVGPGSMVKHVTVRDMKAPVIMGMIAMCCTNAFLCYCCHHGKQSATFAQARDVHLPSLGLSKISDRYRVSDRYWRIFFGVSRYIEQISVSIDRYWRIEKAYRTVHIPSVSAL